MYQMRVDEMGVKDEAERKRLMALGYSAAAIAMFEGNPAGTLGYYEVLREIEGPRPMGCPKCGCPGPIMGTGDCNCGED